MSTGESPIKNTTPEQAGNTVDRDPYLEHIGWLMRSGLFPEATAQASFRSEYAEHRADLIQDGVNNGKA